MFEWTNQLDTEELGDYVIKDKPTLNSNQILPTKQENSSGSEYTDEESDSEDEGKGSVEYISQSDELIEC
jgi:hypothetical protein